MELGPAAERKKDDDEVGSSARASPSSSPSCEAADGDNKQLPKQQQLTGIDEDDDDDEGTRQPYKCTFCKRGFPTAQALGGHMNVHRRHRGIRPAAAAAAASAVVSSTGGASASSVYDYDQQPCSPPTTSVLAFAQQATRPAAAGLHGQQKPPHELLPLFGRGDCCAAGRGSVSGSGAAAGAGDVRGDGGQYVVGKEGDDGGEELDLELRLGGRAGAGAGS